MSKANNGNGTEEVTFKKNVDYFEMAEGTFYTVEALQKKYNLGRSTIYNKARDAGFEIEKIAGFPCFKDDSEVFSKKERKGTAANLDGHRLLTYAELARKIEDMLAVMEEQRIQLINKESEHGSDTRRIVDAVDRLTEQIKYNSNEVKRNNSLIENLIEYLTKKDTEK